MKRPTSFIRLPHHVGLLVEAFVLLIYIRVALRFTSLPRLRQTLKKFSRPKRQVPDDAAEKVAWAIHVTGTYLPNTNCLPQALAAQVLLTRMAQPAALHIGVARDGAGQFKAHAWVESRGVIVIGGSQSPAQFTSLPGKEWESL